MQQFKKVSYQNYEFKKAIIIEPGTQLAPQTQPIENFHEKQGTQFSNNQIQQIINFLVQKLRSLSGTPTQLGRRSTPYKTKYKTSLVAAQTFDCTKQIKNKLSKNKEQLKKKFSEIKKSSQTEKFSKENAENNQLENGQSDQQKHKMKSNCTDPPNGNLITRIVNEEQAQLGILISQKMANTVKQILKKFLFQQIYWKQHTSSLQKAITSQKEALVRYQQVYKTLKNQLITKQKIIEEHNMSMSALVRIHQNQISRISRSKILKEINDNSKQICRSHTIGIEPWKQVQEDRPIKNGTKAIINTEVLGKTVNKALSIMAYVPTEDIKYLTQICSDSAYGTNFGVKNNSSTRQNFRSKENKYFQRYNQKQKKSQVSSNSNAGISRFGNNINEENASLFSNTQNINPGQGTGRNHTAESLSRIKDHLKGGQMLKIKAHHNLLESQIDKQNMIKRSNTAVQLHRKINKDSNKKNLLKEVNQLQKRKETIIQQLANNSVKYEQCINDIDSQIQNKKNRILEIQKNRNSCADINSQYSSDIQRQMRDTIQDCGILKVSTKQNSDQKVQQSGTKVAVNSKLHKQSKNNSKHP